MTKFHIWNVSPETIADRRKVVDFARSHLLIAVLMADLSEQIESEAQGPKRVTTDGVTIEGRTVEEMIEADRYLQSKAATKSKRRGLVISKLSPPGTA